MLAIAQLKVSGLKLIPKVILVWLADCNDLHVYSVDDEFLPEIIPAISGLQHDLDDTIHHIPIGKKATAEAESNESGFWRVIWCHIPVTDS
jgi:hypothetical protein